jgi:L-aspartate oxidase
MQRYDPAGDLAPRDRVARGIVREEERTGGPVFLTLAGLDPEYVRGRFPHISEACRRAGLDLARDRIPVGPAAHYMMGGVVTDVDGRTTLPGLYAAGEVACTGVHGANRLASNSLLEGLVFGARAAAAMRAARDSGAGQRGAAEGGTGSRLSKWAGAQFGNRDQTTTFAAAASSLSVAPDYAPQLLWKHAGLFRDAGGLRLALKQLGALEPDEDTRITVGRLVARAALRREESRGGHYRLDFPDRDDLRWRRRIMETI